MVRLKAAIIRGVTVISGLVIVQKLYLLSRSPHDRYENELDNSDVQKQSYLNNNAFRALHNNQQRAHAVKTATAKATNVLNLQDTAVFDEIENFSSTEKLKQNDRPTKVMSEKEFVLLMQKMHSGTTLETPLDFEHIRIDVDSVGLVTVEKYKQLKVEEFTRENANPAKKSDFPVKLKEFPDSMQRPSPYILIADDTKTVFDEEVRKDCQKEKERGLSYGDEDISKLPEVQRVLERNAMPIPNIIHFIWFSCRKFRVHHYISLLSAWKFQSPELILFHTTCEPKGYYWDSFKSFVGDTLKIVQRTPPLQVWGKPVRKVEHMSDVARLQILLEVGGIYMDDDLVVLKSLNPLRKSEMVLGEENYDAVANSIIMANKDSWFLRRWYQEYLSFNDSRWSDSSCFVPWSLWQLFPDTIQVVKEKMLRPNWEEIRLIYHELWDWHNSYTMHLYSRFMLSMEGTQERNLKELSILNTTYGQIARYVIWDDERPRDISDLIFD
uniref:Uncharacterized protein LOC100184557 n=1 Tax=Phallusia mammillata TaxID=59560 RepID=A0A6F9DIM6_9ASCI|nr:uncharacterized protein LOC100184557 [Phallusia mammillata]